MSGITDEIFEGAVVLPINEEARAVANRLAEGQPTPQKAEQVRLNTLAVSAVNNYLRMMDIPTDITASYSRKPFMLMLNDVADLVIPGLGRLECRPVKAHALTCHFPVEVWDDRIGYVAVQMDKDLEETALFGFIPIVQTEDLPLRQFQPLQNLLQHINQLILNEDESPSLNASQQLTNLRQWLQGKFGSFWQAIEEITSPQQPAIAWRSETELNASNLNSVFLVNRVKLLNFATEFSSENIAIRVGLTPINETEVNIGVLVFPTGDRVSLPEKIQVRLLDESGSEVGKASAGVTKRIEFDFNGHLDEKFGLEIICGEQSITENFVI